MADTTPDEAREKKIGYLNLAIWGGLTFLFCCIGSAVVGVAGADSESAGVQATYLAAGPACCSVSGLLGAVLGMFAFAGKTGLRVGLPIALGVLGGLFGGIGTVVFFEAIFPSL
ncbi:MAG: hypothetical protein VYE22_05020 [Myxococcota bacterium]|nr:hypothetical protein [Myxococcota bacterium]